MIRIIVTLLPSGNEDSQRELAQAEMSNLSPDTHSDYWVSVREAENPLAATEGWEARGMIGRHDGHQSVWALVASAALWASRQAQERASR